MDSLLDEQAENTINSWGIPREYLFLVPIDSNAEQGLILIWFPGIGLRYMKLGNDTMQQACYDYLRRTGARITDEQAVLDEALCEKWEGWESVLSQYVPFGGNQGRAEK